MLIARDLDDLLGNVTENRVSTIDGDTALSYDSADHVFAAGTQPPYQLTTDLRRRTHDERVVRHVRINEASERPSAISSNAINDRPRLEALSSTSHLHA